MTDTHLVEGVSFDSYRLTRQLAMTSGGADLFLAHHELTDRTVLIKFAVQQQVRDVSRYIDLYDRVAGLQHPSIVQIYGTGVFAERAYVAMQYATGGSLRDRLTAGSLSLSETVPIAWSIADALEALVAIGIVHRDVKPSNIVFEGGRALLTDHDVSFESERPRLTLAGTLVGSVDYLAPEVVQGEPATSSSDVYALGTTIFEALAGTTPFGRHSNMATLYAHVSEAPPLISRRMPVESDAQARALDEVIERALAKAPGDRFATAGALARALEAVEHLDAHDPVPRSPGVRPPTTMVGINPVREHATPEVVVVGDDALPYWATAPFRAAVADDPGAEPEDVDCTVFGPAALARGDVAMIQVFAHTPDQHQEAAHMARPNDDEAQECASTALRVPIEPEADLTFELSITGLSVSDPVRRLRWTGRPSAVQFEVEVPADFPGRSMIGTIIVACGSVPVGHLKFKLRVQIDAPKEDDLDARPIAEAVHRYERAFVSYASADRSEVVRRIQALQAVGIEVVADVLSLDPGDRWEAELYTAIDEADLFLLCWSREAERSVWVRRELERALERQDRDVLGPPEIRPIILESPSPPPWPEVAHLHFDDRAGYLIA
jgi:hypothetical protein